MQIKKIKSSDSIFQLSFLNASIVYRFIDVVQGQKLHLWRTESTESSFPSLISSICSCGSDKTQAGGIAASPSWVAAGLSSGKCRLLDVRSGNIIASWQAHDGYVTKVCSFSRSQEQITLV